MLDGHFALSTHYFPLIVDRLCDSWLNNDIFRLFSYVFETQRGRFLSVGADAYRGTVKAAVLCPLQL